MAINALKLRNDRGLVMALLALMLVLLLWYTRSDFVLYGSDPVHLRPRLLARGAMVTLIAAVILSLRRTQTRAAYSRIVFSAALGISLFLLILSALRPPGTPLPIRTALVAIFALYGATPNSFWRQVVPPLFLSVGLVVLRLLWSASSTDGGVALDIELLAIINLCGVIMVRGRLALEDEAALAWSAEHDARVEADRSFAELRTLRGIIPICAHCKQVRTDMGEWQAVERYVAANSAAQFSHGICPSCESAHYGELPLDTV
ncbi:MAG: hypothetical protein ABJE47_00475 [bacterium]